VLFGPTQVGKTTLLLTLMGVRDASFKDVQSVLRGGRPHGRSSTAMPMRYVRSRDGEWRVGDPNGPAWSDDAVREHLSRIRLSVEDGSCQDIDPVVLHIPAGHFSDADPLVQVSVLDLPGIAAAAPNERLLVERIARRYVVAASLVLLVGAASDLGVFDPVRLGEDLEELKDWIRSPMRYRLILTYTYQQDAVRRARERIGGLAELQSFFVEEIEKFAFPTGPSLAPRVYPLDYGESWRVLLAGPDRAYRNWAVGLQADAMRALTEDIALSCQGEARLRVTREVREGAYVRREAIRRTWRKAVEATRRETIVCRTAQENNSGKRRRSQQRRIDTTARLTKFNAAAAGLPSCVHEALASATIAVALGEGPQTLLDGKGQPIGRTVASLQEWVLRDQAKLNAVVAGVTHWFGETAGLSIHWRLPSFDKMERVVERLNGYSHGGYWTWLSGQFGKDCIALYEAAADARRIIAEDVRTSLCSRLDRLRQLLVQDRRRAEEHDRGVVDEGVRLQATAARIRDGRRTVVRELWHRRVALRHDMQRISRFEVEMEGALIVERRRIAAKIREAAAERQAALVLARLCQLRLIEDVHRRYCGSVV